MLKDKQILKHISDRLTSIGFFEYDGKTDICYTVFASDMYNINVRYINENNIRCELTKKEVLGGMMFTGKVMTSCVVSDWHKNQLEVVDKWVDNMLEIPEIIIKLRSNKIKKIKEKC